MEDAKSFLFSPDGQNGSMVWRKRVVSLENNLEALVDFFWLNINVQAIRSMNDVTVPREGSSLEVLASGGDHRVWRWKGLPS